MRTPIPSLLFFLALGGAATAQVVEFERDAAAWKASAPIWTGAAFDVEFPGCDGFGCLACDGQPVACQTCSSDASVTLVLDGGIVTISQVEIADTSNFSCPIGDNAGPERTSDALIDDSSRKLVLEFTPPISAFYSFYGALPSGATVTMDLYGESLLIDALVSAPSPDNQLASGHGFVSSEPVHRIELTHSMPSAVAVGAFLGLAGGESGLGSVFAPGYGADADFDFGYVFGDPMAPRIYVAPTGSDTGGCGLTPGSPCQTIGFGVTRAVATSRTVVAVQAGTYHEPVHMQDGVSIEGGYDASWDFGDGLDPLDPSHRVEIVGNLDLGIDQYVVVNAEGLASQTTLSNLVLIGPDAADTDAFGNTRSSYGVRAVDSDGLNLIHLRIEAGDGEDGADGLNGVDAPQFAPAPGSNGQGGFDYGSGCDTTASLGGVGATNPPAGSGGDGGNGGRADTDCSGLIHDNHATGGHNGTAGELNGSGCGGYGAGGGVCGAGGTGNPGSCFHGSGGAGGTAGSFDLLNGVWHTEKGADGTLGEHGGGGGGGGGAGGCDSGLGDCRGPGGGGGGAGGLAAPSAGQGGYGGGNSFGVFAVGSDLHAQDLEVIQGSGGDGGNGGAGRLGQPGGDGGTGGGSPGPCLPAGNGRKGGNGGNSGGGGGGAAGASLAIVADRTSSLEIFDLVTTIGTTGQPGAGGAGPGVAGACPSVGVDDTAGEDGTFPGTVENLLAGTMHVTIGDAIFAASDGDVLVASPAVYAESVDFGGKAITLRSLDPEDPAIVAATIINALPLFATAVECVNGEGPDTVLEGFTITGYQVETAGGGMLNVGSSPTVNRCIFTGCNADSGTGGGMHNQASNPTLTLCQFIDNSADQGRGAGMYNDDSDPVLIACTFVDNHAAESGSPTTGRGGGMYNDSSDPTLVDCQFVGNTSRNGAAMYNVDSAPSVTNGVFESNSASSTNSAAGGAVVADLLSAPTFVDCVFRANSATGVTSAAGGALIDLNSSSSSLVNCTLLGNSVAASGAAGGAVATFDVSMTTLDNCIVWGSGPTPLFGATSVSYSDVQGGSPGPGNVNLAPRFVNAAGGDLRLSPRSPCIDAGDNFAVPPGVTTDLGGRPRFSDDPATADTGLGGAPVVDMGAFEFLIEAVQVVQH